ncbi:MAG: NAD(P)H-binding protein, partial [Pseudomonadota bacterium]
SQSGAETLKQLGAEPVIADLNDPTSLETVMQRVEAVFLASADGPQQDRIEADQIAMFARQGRPHVVKLSAQSAGLDPPVSFGIQHRRSEQALEASGLPYTILRPTFFQQSLLLFADDVAKKGKITAPVGKGKIAMVNVDDVARMAATVIANEDHHGKTYTLTGPAALGFDEVVGHLSKTLDRKVGHTSPPAFAARLVLPFVTGMPRWQSNLVVDLLSALKAGAQQEVSTDIEKVTGQSPGSVEDFLKANLEAFRP